MTSPPGWFCRASVRFLPWRFLLGHAVHLLGIDQAGPVRLQNPKRRVVLEGGEDAGARILPLVQDPNTGWDSHHSDHTEDDQDGQHQAGLCAEQAAMLGAQTHNSGIKRQRLLTLRYFLCLWQTNASRQKREKQIQTQMNDVTSSDSYLNAIIGVYARPRTQPSYPAWPHRPLHSPLHPGSWPSPTGRCCCAEQRTSPWVGGPERSRPPSWWTLQRCCQTISWCHLTKCTVSRPAGTGFAARVHNTGTGALFRLLFVWF